LKFFLPSPSGPSSSPIGISLIVRISTAFNHILKTKNELKFTVETVKVFFHSRVDHDVAILHSLEESFSSLGLSGSISLYSRC
jgi:hypothetical protein